MDLSIIEDVFALRERMEKARFGIDVPELAELAREEDQELFKRLEHLPDEKDAASAMDRAAKLDAASDKWFAAASAPERRLRPEIVQLLTAAVAPLPMFDDAELTSVAVPPVRAEPNVPPVRAEPNVPRPPSRPSPRAPEPEPIRDVAPRAADTTASTPTRKPAKKPSKKTTKKSTRKPKKKPE